MVTLCISGPSFAVLGALFVIGINRVVAWQWVESTVVNVYNVSGGDRAWWWWWWKWERDGHARCDHMVLT